MVKRNGGKRRIHDHEKDACLRREQELRMNAMTFRNSAEAVLSFSQCLLACQPLGHGRGAFMPTWQRKRLQSCPKC